MKKKLSLDEKLSSIDKYSKDDIHNAVNFLVTNNMREGKETLTPE